MPFCCTENEGEPVSGEQVMRSLTSLASNSTLLLLSLQQPHSPPSEEVERVAVGVLLADVERRVLVS